MMRSMNVDDWAPWHPVADTARPFAAARVEELAERSGMHIPETVLGAATAALRAGKHVILTGPPGTGKSTLAKLLAEAAQQALMCSGYLAATATSDWTIGDTVGTSHDTSEGRVFRAGVVTDAIETGRWLLIDEFNRADIDQAFGELFSVLSGQAVVLPHRRNEFAPRPSRVRTARRDRSDLHPEAVAHDRHDEHVRPRPALHPVARPDATIRLRERQLA
jgi:MoxR-like ATPase